MSTLSESRGRIVETRENGSSILWTYVPEMPTEDRRHSLPWLAVLAWPYDGSSRNGMPSLEVNESMLKLEDVLGKIERHDFCVEAYRRVGGGRREFVFYLADREQFLAELNSRTAGHERYPIDINFYRDESWSELQELIDDLGVA